MPRFRDALSRVPNGGTPNTGTARLRMVLEDVYVCGEAFSAPLAGKEGAVLLSSQTLRALPPPTLLLYQAAAGVAAGAVAGAGASRCEKMPMMLPMMPPSSCFAASAARFFAR